MREEGKESRGQSIGHELVDWWIHPSKGPIVQNDDSQIYGFALTWSQESVSAFYFLVVGRSEAP